MPSDLQLEYFLSNKKTDWSTSTAVAHPVPFKGYLRSQALNPFSQITSRPGCVPLVPVPHSWMLDDDVLMKLRQEQHATTANSKYTNKSIYPRNKIHHAPPSCEKIQYVKSFLEYPHRMLLPKPTPTSGSHYQEEFTEKFANRPKPSEFHGLLDIKKYSSAKALNEPTFNIVHGGVEIHLDPYATTSQLTHRPFSHYERTGILYDKAVGSFHDTYEVEKALGDKRNVLLKVPIRLYPIYDSLVFQSKATIRILPKTTHAVPHKGLLTETQEQYRLH
ncbi:hypothetical protein R5R35_011893 [Gryllus longicercus]|uniref:Uncharacterized protein n=1 Tax=Gryllus longicercus TaxID=2509291 RepID=A0AAN9WKM2_9ORTH